MRSNWWLMLALAAGPVLAAPGLVLTGEVQATQAEPILTPESQSSPVVLRYFAPEGAKVKRGDVLVRIDPGEAAQQVRTLEAQIEQARAKSDKEIAELRVKSLEAERLWVDAQAALDKARIDAKVPRDYRAALDYDRFQGEAERATREELLRAGEFHDAESAAQRRVEDGKLEVAKLEADRRFNQHQVDAAEQRAERDGVVVHRFDPWRGTRFDEGSSANMGQKVGEVVGNGPMAVRAWAPEPDRAALAPKLPVTLCFDAVPGRCIDAVIDTVSGSPEERKSWGAGRYFAIDIALPDEALKLPLLPGMSARVELGKGASP
jgi:HlyD family secretion protein